MLFVAIAAALVVGACAHGGKHHPCEEGKGPCPPCPNCPQGAPAGAEKAPQQSSVIYWCNCGPECKCNAVATKPGKCGCGKEMAGGHVLFIEGSTALVCPCGPDCTCKIDPKDHSKCGCGKAVKKIDLKGTGLYFCNCAGACGCATVSDKPGTCKCGMELHQAK